MTEDLEKLKGVKKIAVFGGTFDPVHNGHISVAREALKKTDVEMVLFIPNCFPPHKRDVEVSESQNRLDMIKLALNDEDNMTFSSIEVDKGSITYTVDTITQLKKEMGNEVHFKFIIGADAIHYISTWKNYKKLLEICDFIAVTRPGYKKNQLISEINEFENTLDCDIDFVEIEPVEISSSMIREYVKKGISINGLVPEKVEEYIDVKGLYK